VAQRPGRSDGNPWEPAPSTAAKAAQAVAGGAQTVVLLGTLLLGLGWGGPTHLLALLQAAVAFVPLLRFAAQGRTGLVLLVPLLSAGLSGGLLAASQVAPAAAGTAPPASAVQHDAGL
jgi:hypothetical protein